MTTIGESQSDQAQMKECLLGQGNSVSNSDCPTLGRGRLAWEASTLPLSYTRPNHTYFNSKIHRCKERRLEESGNSLTAPFIYANFMGKLRGGKICEKYHNLALELYYGDGHLDS